MFTAIHIIVERLRRKKRGISISSRRTSGELEIVIKKKGHTSACPFAIKKSFLNYFLSVLR
jgi:hypothetical protein